VLRRIFGPKRDEVTGDWKSLHNEELNDLYSSPNILQMAKSRHMRWVGHIALMGERRGAYRILMGKPAGNSFCITGYLVPEILKERPEFCEELLKIKGVGSLKHLEPITY